MTVLKKKKEKKGSSDFLALGMGKMIVDFEWSPASMFVSCSVGLFCQFSSGSEDSILAADCHPRLAWVSSSL